jgi:hypothetical protein
MIAIFTQRLSQNTLHLASYAPVVDASNTMLTFNIKPDFNRKIFLTGSTEKNYYFSSSPPYTDTANLRNTTFSGVLYKENKNALYGGHVRPFVL